MRLRAASEAKPPLHDFDAVGREFKPERITGVEMPDLHGVEAVPGGYLTRFQEVVDRGQHAPVPVLGLVAIRLAVMPALGMRAKIVRADEIVGVHGEPSAPLACRETGIPALAGARVRRAIMGATERRHYLPRRVAGQRLGDFGPGCRRCDARHCNRRRVGLAHGSFRRSGRG